MKIIVEAIGWITIVVALIILTVKLMSVLQRKGQAPTRPPNDFSTRLNLQKELMSDLIRACNGNKQTAIRLIERERNLDPSLKTLEAIDRAIAKLARDRGGYSKER